MASQKQRPAPPAASHSASVLNGPYVVPEAVYSHPVVQQSSSVTHPHGSGSQVVPLPLNTPPISVHSDSSRTLHTPASQHAPQQQVQVQGIPVNVLDSGNRKRAGGHLLVRGSVAERPEDRLPAYRLHWSATRGSSSGLPHPLGKHPVLWCLSVDDCTDRVLHLLATRSARETLGLNCEIKTRGPSLSRLHSGWYCDSPASAGSRCALTTPTGCGVG